jgi:hypothetical protein
MKDKLEAIEKDTELAANQHVKSSEPNKPDITDSMSDELFEIYEKEKKAYQEFRDDMISFNYDRGSVARTVRGNPKLGDKAVEQLSKALSVDKSTVYKTITFSSMYTTKSELNKVVQRAKDSGFVLTWSHFASVMHLPSSSETDPHDNRRKMIDKAISGKLSVRDLMSEIKTEFGGTTAKRTSNRGSEVSSTIKQVISGTERYQAKIKAQVENVLADFTEVVNQIEKPDEFLSKVEEMHETVATLSTMLARILVFTENLPSVTKKAIEERAVAKKALTDSDKSESVSKTKSRRPASIDSKLSS